MFVTTLTRDDLPRRAGKSEAHACPTYKTTWLRAVLVLIAILPTATPASAHPHMWVTYEMNVDYDKGTVVGVDHAWTFDDAYTAMALEGLDKNNDGKYDHSELADLLKVNIDGLKDFNYFTVAKLGSEELGFLPPTNARLEYKDGILRLFFHLPLGKARARRR